MTHSKQLRILLRATTLMTIVVAVQGSQPQPSKIRRIELQRQALAVPRREVIQVRVEPDPGAAFGRHQHPGEEVIYVISGSFEYEVEGRRGIRLSAGDVLFIPSGVIHAARNVGSDTAAELATYIVETGKPLVVLAN